MLNKKLLWQSLLYALGVTVYVVGISYFLNNANKWFGQINGIWGPALILLLLCLSAAIVGSLIFGRPAYLIIAGKKEEGIKMFFYNLMWLAIVTILAFAIFATLAPHYPSMYGAY